jgi:hypothetical protein
MENSKNIVISYREYVRINAKRLYKNYKGVKSLFQNFKEFCTLMYSELTEGKNYLAV